MRKRKNRNRRAGELPAPEATAIDKAAAKKKILPAVFDIPGSALSGIAHIEMAGNREAVIDGCQGVVEYDENIIKLSTGKMVIKFSGRDLQIKTLTHDSAVVSGFILAMEFLV
jgi:sporulation protein YqfC